MHKCINTHISLHASPSLYMCTCIHTPEWSASASRMASGARTVPNVPIDVTPFRMLRQCPAAWGLIVEGVGFGV